MRYENLQVSCSKSPHVSARTLPNLTTRLSLELQHNVLIHKFMKYLLIVNNYVTNDPDKDWALRREWPPSRLHKVLTYSCSARLDQYHPRHGHVFRRDNNILAKSSNSQCRDQYSQHKTTD